MRSASGSRACRAVSAASASSRSPLVATITGSRTTTPGRTFSSQLPDGVDHGGVAEHADLDGVDADVVADGVQLRGQEFGRRNVDGPDAAGVLGRQGGDGGHAVAAVRGNAFQVGLDSGAAGGVRAGDGQHARNPGRRRHVAPEGRKLRMEGQLSHERHPFAGANRTGSTGLDLSRLDARHPVSVPQPSRTGLTNARARPGLGELLRRSGPHPRPCWIVLSGATAPTPARRRRG